MNRMDGTSDRRVPTHCLRLTVGTTHTPYITTDHPADLLINDMQINRLNMEIR